MGRTAAWGLLAFVCLGTPWWLRSLLLAEKRLPLGSWDLRGFLADASVGLLVLAASSALIACPRNWSRALALIPLFAFLISSFAMYEFIRVFDSLYALSHAGFLADATFLGGSVRHVEHPVWFAFALVAAAVALWFAEVPKGRAWRVGLAVAFMLATGLLASIRPTYDFAEWRQRHPIYANLLAVGPRGLDKATIGRDVREVFSADLSGERWFGPLEGRPNVLLVLLEGASAAYLPSIARTQNLVTETTMPGLDAWADRHVLFTQVVSHQRQTNRGEYAILCGDYPKLASGQSKMSEQAYEGARPCLPRMLSDAGYFTSYIQAAPLAFMLKDQFMRNAGFEELLGHRWFKRAYARTDWGVDDEAFFERALERVLELHRKPRPFFATLLTVGTHHPFTVPPSYRPAGAESRQARAFRYLDDAVTSFLARLEENGVLEDTIVLLTSDESAGLPRPRDSAQLLLGQSWSFVIAALPGARPRRVRTLVGHIDLSLSLADLLQISNEPYRFIGRSLFRRYDVERRIFAANTYARRVLMWEPGGAVVICREPSTVCRRSVPLGSRVFGTDRFDKPVGLPTRELVAEVVRLSFSDPPEVVPTRPLRLLVEREVELRAGEGRRIVFGGQYLQVPQSTEVRVDIDVEVVGDDAVVDLHQDTLISGFPRKDRQGVILRGGQRWRFSYSVDVLQDSDQLVCQLYATLVEGRQADLRFHRAELSFKPTTARAESTVVIEDEVTEAGSE